MAVTGPSWIYISKEGFDNNFELDYRREFNSILLTPSIMKFSVNS